jgi:hypothetical protein
MDNRKFMEELEELTKDAELFNRLKHTARLVEKWTPTNLLKGNYNALERAALAQLLQNQALEVRRTLHEATDTADIAGFNKIAFPLVKKVFDKLIAQDLVSFQTMSLPSGLIFYQDYQFETAQPGFTVGNPIYQDLDTSVSGRLGGRGAGLATGGFYNLKSTYSKRYMDAAAVTVTGVSNVQFIFPVASLPGIGATNGFDETFLLYLPGTGALSATFANAAEFVSFSGVNVTFELTDTSTTTAWLASTMTGAGTAVAIKYVPATDLNNRGDWESLSAIPSVNMRLANIPVYAETRKIQTSWTQEGAQDLMAYQGVDAEVELTSTLTDITSTEINNNILNDLLQAAKVAGNSDYWSFKIGDYVDTAGATLTGYSSTSQPGFHGTQREWNETLVNKIQKQMNQIFKKTFLSNNSQYTAVTSPDIATILEATLAWKTSEIAENTYSAGIEKIGSISNKITFLKHASFPTTDILITRKGNNWLDTGYVYAPYVLVYMTPTVLDPYNYTPRKMLMTRDVRQVVKPEYFSRLRILNSNAI